MVRLTKIYTKTGDDGTTGLGDGKRVPKDDVRVAAYGDVDEANCAIGVAVVAAGRAKPGTTNAKLRPLLQSIQHDLFDCGADLCCPRTKDEKPGARLRVIAAQTARLERAIDRHNEGLAPLNSFVLPGGSELAAALHVARTVVRRAERTVATLLRKQPSATNTEVLLYLNRLSDLLFVLSRVANGRGKSDVLWVPGANRPATT